MLKDWHKEDVFSALRNRGWTGPLPLSVESYMVGEACKFLRGAETLNLFFVADMGTGFKGAKSTEAIWARLEPGEESYELWLHRARDAKWKKGLHDWAGQVSSGAKTAQ